MEIIVETETYNPRRCGKPWIARVDFSTNANKGNYNWGMWTGDHHNGGEGILTLTAEINDIVARGQKDNRQPRNSAPRFFVVTSDGLTKIGDKGAAYKHYLDTKKNGVDKDTLQKERKTLIARIAEIDKLIDN